MSSFTIKISTTLSITFNSITMVCNIFLDNSIALFYFCINHYIKPFMKRIIIFKNIEVSSIHIQTDCTIFIYEMISIA
ncbi:unknown [Bacteroides ovatus CAG:22]|nr:unknown [Bacteroides ovatus CAG:22]